jgi:uncharacterized repeat protein (TIGR01451 family)
MTTFRFAWLGALLFSLVAGQVGILPNARSYGLGDHAPGTVLVGLDGLSLSTTTVAGLDIVATIPGLDVAVVQVPIGQERSALEALRRDPRVAFAELNYAAHATEAIIPNDPGWVRQWGPQKINAPEAWMMTQGSPDVVLAVLDSGVTLSHPELTSQLWFNPGEVPSNGLDDDDNGKVDDLWGWHFYHVWNGQVYVPRDDDLVADDYGHGTHVAGIAGAEMNNGQGIAGMAAASRLMIVKVLDQYGVGWYSDIAQGIVYAVDNGASILNLSLGGTQPSEILQAAVDYAHSRGVLVVAAAGNDGTSVLYPAACEHALAVAATDMYDQHPSFSNHGPQVDAAAPGVDIYSTWPWRDGYWTQYGTSMAAPNVSGLAALIRSRRYTLDQEEVTHVITRAALDVETPGWDPYTGWGRIDAQAAMLYAERYPLDLAKQVTPAQLVPGAPVTYTITVSNEGDVLADIILSDTLPAEVEFSAANPQGTYYPARHELVWSPLTATAGARVTLTVVGTIVAGIAPCAVITNTVYLFYESEALPLQAAVSHRARPCYVYLPSISRRH